MKWRGNRESSNVEDRRGQPGGGGGFRMGGGRIGIGTVAIALVVSLLFDINPLTVLNILSGGGGEYTTTSQSQTPATPRAAPQDEMGKFVSVVLADTEDVWTELFAAQGRTYAEPRLVLFRGSVPTACGQGQSAMGPFYCPGDSKVYIDLGFYETLKNELGAPGDFAQAYVIAHEVGHHVQNLLGISRQVQEMRGRVSQVQYNALSVKTELQADCFAGVWAHHAQRTRQILEDGDIEEAMNAAAKIGDDALQKKSQGRVVPDSFTHGTSRQRMDWFQRGFQTGQMGRCNTFDAATL